MELILGQVERDEIPRRLRLSMRRRLSLNAEGRTSVTDVAAIQLCNSDPTVPELHCPSLQSLAVHAQL